jgi:hypothetical protein
MEFAEPRRGRCGRSRIVLNPDVQSCPYSGPEHIMTKPVVPKKATVQLTAGMGFRNEDFIAAGFFSIFWPGPTRSALNSAD